MFRGRGGKDLLASHLAGLLTIQHARCLRLPCTRRYGRKVTLGDARTLLERAPTLRTLGLDATLRITLPAHRLLRDAGVSAELYIPEVESEPDDE